MNTLTHKILAPVCFCLAWILGGLLSWWISTYFFVKEDVFLSCVISIYLSLLLEGVITFIDLGAVNATEKFEGSVFYIIAFILLHCFITFFMILSLANNHDFLMTILLFMFTAFLRFAISWLSANVKYFMVTMPSNSLRSNIIN